MSSVTEATFYTSTRGNSITLVSQLGPLPAHSVRLPNPALAGFIKEIPVLPDSFVKGAPGLLATYREKNLVRDITLEDVLADLGRHALTVEEMVEAFKWWMTLASNRSYSGALLDKLKDAAMLFVMSPTAGESIYPLSQFKSFLNPKLISADLPLPPHTLPFAVTRTFNPGDLNHTFHFDELSLLEWVRHLLSPALTGSSAPADTNILVSPPFAEKVGIVADLAMSLTLMTLGRY